MQCAYCMMVMMMMMTTEPTDGDTDGRDEGEGARMSAETGTGQEPGGEASKTKTQK